MGLQRKQRDEIDDSQPVEEHQQPETPQLEVAENTLPEPVEEPALPKKVGRPKKARKPRTKKQLENDERQRQKHSRGSDDSGQVSQTKKVKFGLRS